MHIGWSLRGQRRLGRRCHAVLQRLAQTHRVGERGQADVAHARAVQIEPAEVEQPAEQALVEFDFLDRA